MKLEKRYGAIKNNLISDRQTNKQTDGLTELVLERESKKKLERELEIAIGS